MKKHHIYPTLKKHLEKGHIKSLLKFCDALHPADLAGAMEKVPVSETVRLFDKVGPRCASKVLSHMGSGDQANILPELSDADLSEIINEMSSDDRVDLIRIIPHERRQKLMQMLSRAEREDIIRLERHSEGTAGAIMTSEYIAFSEDITVREAMDIIRLEAADKETIYFTYVIDKEHRLFGSVTLRKLILAKTETKVRELMHLDPVRVRVEDDQEIAAGKMKKYDLLAIPVTDDDEILAGIITHDDIHDVIVEEATEDFHRFGAVIHEPPDLNLSMGQAGIWTMIRKRLPWLLILVFMNIFSGAGIAYFEDTIEAVVALVFFLPLLIGSGGNAGAQSATLMIRAIAVGDVKLKDWFGLLGKEVSVAIGIGMIMGLAVSLIGILRAGPEVAVVVAMTMILTVLFGSLVGMSLPFLLTRLKMDPASASAPLVTSIADIGGVLIYFSIATWYLRDIIAASGGV